MGRSPAYYNPIISMIITQRKVWVVRDQTAEYRRMTLVGNTHGRLHISGEWLDAVAITVTEGSHQFEGREVLGGASFNEAYSTQETYYPIKDLLKNRSEHHKKGEEDTRFAGEGYFQPATVGISIWVKPSTFDLISTVDLESTEVFFNFQFNAKEDESVTSSGDIVSWAIEREPHVEAEHFNFRLEPKEKIPTSVVEPIEPTYKTMTPFELAVIDKLRMFEQGLTWCLLALIALCVASIFIFFKGH